MKTFLLMAFVCMGLAACGPREIGHGYSEETGPGPDATAADQMRLPMTGANNTQRMLYYYNRPEIMQQVQSMRLSQYNRMMGVQPSPEDPFYRAMPKQRSPFRQ